MNSKKGGTIKAQEWLVRFDGIVKRSEMKIDSDEHHELINNVIKVED